MKTIKKITLFFILSIFISCGQQNNSSVNKDTLVKSKILNISLADTVFKNQVFFGEIRYDMNLDTLKPLDIRERYVLLYITNDEKALSLEDIKKTNHNIFIDTVGNGFFHFNAAFPTAGNQKLKGAIEDIVMLKEDSTENVRILTEITIVTMNVFIKE